MPSDLDNAKLMLLCLQFSTAATFDYKKIGDACGISAGAASKRMSRLKQGIKEGKTTGLDVKYLWSCIQHSDIGNINFRAIAKELKLPSTGAASKRWSRLKQAFERGDSASSGAAATRATKGAAAGRRKRKSSTDDDGAGAAGGRRGNKKAKGHKIKAEATDDNNGNGHADMPVTPANPGPQRITCITPETKSLVTTCKQRAATTAADVMTSSESSKPACFSSRQRSTSLDGNGYGESDTHAYDMSSPTPCNLYDTLKKLQRPTVRASHVQNDGTMTLGDNDNGKPGHVRGKKAGIDDISDRRVSEHLMPVNSSPKKKVATRRASAQAGVSQGRASRLLSLEKLPDPFTADGLECV